MRIESNRRVGGRAAGITKRAGAALAVVGTVLLGLVFLANPASAHHPELSARADCDTLGKIKISYDAYSWTSTESGSPFRFAISRANIAGAPTYGTPAAQAVGWVTVDYTPAGGLTTVLPDASTPSGNREHAFDNASDVESGSFLVDDDEDLFPIRVHVEDHGRWKNNADASGTTTNAAAATMVAYPDQSCQPPPAEPSASQSWLCGDENIVVDLSNDGGQGVDFDVNGTIVTVDPYSSTQTLVPGPAEDETVQVTVKVGDQTIGTPVTHDGNCQNPAATVDWTCGSAVVVTLTNAGAQSSVDFDVDGTTYPVAPGASTPVDLGVPAEGSAIDVTVTAPGMTPVTLVEDAVDCQNPAATVEWTCGTSIVVTLSNAGAQSGVAFDVNGTGHALAAGETKVVDLGVPAEGSAIDVDVTAPGMTPVAYDVESVDCENPAATVVWECGSSVVVTLTNTGGQSPVTFEVNGDDQLVGADGTEVVDLGVPAEGSAIDVTVTAPGMDDVTFAEAQVDCDGVLCDAAETGVDGDEDGDADSCLPVECEDDETPVAGDDDTNGIADTCEPECVEDDTPVAGGVDLSDPDDPCETRGSSNNVTREPPEVLDNTVVGPAAQPTQTGALAFTGVESSTVAAGAAMLLLLGLGLVFVGKEFGEA